MTPSRLQYLLEHYLDGTATEAEQAEYDHWYAQQQAPDTDVFTPAEKKEMYQVIASGIREKKPVVYLRWVAAAAVVGILASIWLFRTTPPAVRKEIAMHTVKAPDTTEIRNGEAGQRRLHLPDGSSVILYKDAAIRFAASFGKKDRVIMLEGKGYFNVAPHAPQPFTVWSQGVSTTALGTSFTITSIRKEVKVMLHTGKVVVKADKETRYLTPGQWLICNTSTGTARMQPAEKITPASPVIAYGSRNGFAATFDQMPLSGVLDTISKGYHVNIQMKAAAFEDIAFSGVIRDTDSLAQVLHRIAMLHDLKIISTNTGYRIEKNH
ncbi:FecR family protein [Chitinophaga arvensicola]|uniref:Ferric-dicitrate binding protein FerR, regulates iron transport through sigma-19 n=1 Tax=Chitinophaga arvensicola TaxID=29529 RepID=A0A1I0SD03_9BACT|nr:FecR domain-containing protein [Chitinophaga arvensicola]SEW54976.1 ferric-dicitrate binding protein FerR, regulates iron transport through sigma-19 [Chitinophaga arvensicola]